MSIISEAKKVFPEIVPELGNYYGQISEWDRIYSNSPPWKKVKKSGLYASGNRSMSMLLAAKVAADEFSRLTFSEQVTVSAAEPYGEYVSKVLDRCGFWRRFPDFLSCAYALGGGAAKIYAADGSPAIDYISADRFVPTAWDEGGISEGIFQSKICKNGFYYTLFERYFTENGLAAVDYRLFRSGQKSTIGNEVSLSELFPELPENVRYNTAKVPMFRYFKPDVSNNIDRYSPLGVSVFSAAIDTLKALDVAFDSFSREFVLGKKRIIVPSSCIQTVVDVETGAVKRYFDPDDEAYVALKCDDEKSLDIKDNTVELRVEEHVSAINALLDLLCFQVGLSSGAFSFNGSQGLKTATEVVSADSKTARTAKANKNLLQEFIQGIVESVIALGVDLGDVPPSDDYGIVITMPDGVVIDDNTKIENNIKLVSAGLKSKVSAIMDIFGCEEDEALKELERISKESQISADMIDLNALGGN